jgi:hypothetical protein
VAHSTDAASLMLFECVESLATLFGDRLTVEHRRPSEGK